MLRRHLPLRVEMLEDRSVPAVTVRGFNVADIKITGDNQSNDIEITMANQVIEVQAHGSTTLTLDSSTPASWVVTNTPTSITLNPNGASNPNPATLDNLHVSMLDGNDSVTVHDLQTNGNAIIML